MSTHTTTLHRWYREPWPWLLMFGPATVVVAGIITTWLAIATNDGLVADDYYKRGLAINQTLSRDALARQLGYRARVTLAADFGRVLVAFADGAPVSGPLVLRLAHHGRTSFDRALPLTRESGQSLSYVAAFPPLAPGRWQVILEDTGRTWRLTGDLSVPGRGELDLAPR